MLATEKQLKLVHKIVSFTEDNEDVCKLADMGYRDLLLEYRKEHIRVREEVGRRSCQLTKREAHLFISKYLIIYKELLDLQKKEIDKLLYGSNCSGYDKRAYGVYSMEERWD